MTDSFTLLPVLTQWVVYAIRNLKEDNSRNQDLIAKMEEQGLADASLLKKMGFEVEKRGDKLILKSTNDTPQLVSVTGGGLVPLQSVGSGPHFPITFKVTRFLHKNMGRCSLPPEMAKKALHLIANNFLFMLYLAVFLRELKFQTCFRGKKEKAYQNFHVF